MLYAVEAMSISQLTGRNNEQEQSDTQIEESIVEIECYAGFTLGGKCRRMSHLSINGAESKRDAREKKAMCTVPIR